MEIPLSGVRRPLGQYISGKAETATFNRSVAAAALQAPGNTTNESSGLIVQASADAYLHAFVSLLVLRLRLLLLLLMLLLLSLPLL